MKKLLIELAVRLLGNKDSRRKIFIAVGSVAVGFLMLMFLPVALLSGIANRDSGSSGISEELDSDVRIAEAMAAIGLQEQTTQAQLIYTLYFISTPLEDFTGYANMFNITDDETLIENINGYFGLNIDYQEYSGFYRMVMNASISEYIFTDTSCKNSDDLAAWCRNVYASDWEYTDNSYGESVGENGVRSADNVGLIMGYLRYSPSEKQFSTDIDTLIYTEQGGIDTMPDVQGVGVYNGSDFGIYIGSGEVVFSSAMGGIVRESLENGGWTSWCTFEGISYPQAVTDRINEIQNPTEENTEEETTENGE